MPESLLSRFGGKYKSIVSMIKPCTVTQFLELSITQETFERENQP